MVLGIKKARYCSGTDMRESRNARKKESCDSFEKIFWRKTWHDRKVKKKKKRPISFIHSIIHAFNHTEASALS